MRNCAATKGSGLDARVEDLAWSRRPREPDAGVRDAIDEDDRRNPRQLRGWRRAQRTGRQAEAIAEADAAVDQSEAEILGEGRALQAVVENQHTGPRRDRRLGRRASVAGGETRRDAREQQRFVADLLGAVNDADRRRSLCAPAPP